MNENDIEMDWLIDKHLREFWRLYITTGPFLATKYLNDHLSRNGKLVVPVFIFFRIKRPKNCAVPLYTRASTCIHIHYQLDPHHIEALQDGWKNANTDERSVNYWMMLFAEAQVVLNEIQRIYRIIFQNKPNVAFRTVEMMAKTDKKTKTTGYITIDYSY